MKIIKLLFLIIIGTVFFLQPVKAECRYLNYYGYYEYVLKDNFIDNQGENSILGFANSENIYYTINGLGNYNNPHAISTKTLTQGSYTTKELSEKDPVYFEIKFFETIKIKELEFEIIVANNSSIKKYIYVNADLNNSVDNQIINIKKTGTLIEVVDTNDRVKVDLNNLEVNNLFIVFDNRIDNVYTLNYFQINEYSKKAQVGWTQTYQANTNIKQVYLCENTGEYLPNGTDGKWYQSYVTSFSPTVKIANDFIPKLSSYKVVAYDVRNDGHDILANSSPKVIQYKLDYDQMITAWENLGDTHNPVWYSKTENSDYIKISDTSGFRYVITPIYWDNKQANSISELHNGWCKIFTGNVYSNDCYKHLNHSTNSYQNRFDIGIKTYTNVIDRDKQKISKVDYYLCNNYDECEYLKTTKDETSSIELKQSGRYYLMADVFDLYDNHNTKKSEYFLIDNLKPIVNFNYETTKEYVTIAWDLEDTLSGINKFRYQISNDGGVTYGEFSDWIEQNKYQQTFYNNGDYTIKIEAIDNAANSIIVNSEIIPLKKANLQVNTIYGFVYDIKQPASLHFNIKCQNCQQQPIKIEVFQDGKIISDWDDVIDENQNYVINYIGSAVKSNFMINASLIDETSKTTSLSITTYEQSNNVYQSSEPFLNVSEIVCSMVNEDNQQTNYYEYLTYEVVNLTSDLKVGEGIETKVNENYYNSCASVVDFVCQTSTESNAEFSSVFIDAPANLQNKYLSDGKYVVSLKYVDSQYQLPLMYADKQKGTIYDQKIDTDLIEAGRKWYTNLNSKIGTYTYQIIGEHIGLNNIQLLFDGKYNLTDTLTSDLKTRFVDANNPFPNGVSSIWDIQYFENLKKQAVKMILYFSDLK